MDESDPIDSQDAWSACPTGTLNQAVEEIRARERQHSVRRVTRVGGGLCAMLLVALAAGLYLNRGPMNAGGITCDQCVSHMQAFDSESLEPKLTESMQTHLEHCKNCQDHYRKAIGPLPANVNVAMFESFDWSATDESRMVEQTLAGGIRYELAHTDQVPSGASLHRSRGRDSLPSTWYTLRWAPKQ